MLHQVFAPHGMCMMWNQKLIWLHVITDSLVALSYYSIPAALFLLAYRKRETVPVRPLLILFGLFIAFCGAGHALDIVSIWHPIYWFKGWWNAGTAATSVVTAIILVPKVAEFVSMPERTAMLEREKQVLQEKHGVLQAVLDSISEGILLVDESGRTLAHNAAASQILGPSLEAGTQHELLQNAPVGLDVETLPDGRILERFTRGVPGLGRVFVVRDITEQRRLEESRLRLEHVIATMQQGFAIVTLDDARIQTTNPGFTAMHGYQPGELDGRKLSDVVDNSLGDNSLREEAIPTILAAAERDFFWEGEITGCRKDHTTFPAALRVNLHQGNGKRYVSMIQVDFTEQKRLQEEAAKLQTKLLQAQKLESLGVLAGGVAHDFNNLLTGIMGNTSLAIDSLPPSSSLRPRLKDVLKASERAADLTRQLLAYSGKGRFIVEPIDISALVKETHALVQISVPRTVQVRMQLDPALPRVEADASQIQQLIMNLVINAAEAIGETPGNVQLNTGVQTLDEKDIAGTFANDKLVSGPYVYVEVQDNGCGMSEETKAQIFDPFFTTKFTGRGLGLAAALGIVRSHGGTLKVYTVLGRGTTFKVFLPVWHGEPVEVPVADRPTDLRGTGTVLVVDDEETVRTTTYNALTFYGYTVELAENGALAMDLFEREPGRFSAVLLDMTMPVMSGEETLRRIRKIRPEIPIILTSGFNESEAVRRFAGKGLSGFLQKPYTSSQLATQIKAALNA